MKTVAFFNSKGGVGTTSLAYHLAWMYADLGVKVIVADLDPQATLSSMFLDEERLEALWPATAHEHTILGAVQPLLDGIGDVARPHIEDIADNIGLLVGDLGLCSFEDELSVYWADCLAGKARAFRVISAFYRLLSQAAVEREADVVLIDVGPNLGSLNRATLIAAEYVVIPLAPDLSSLQGLRNLGPTLRRWRGEWAERLKKNPEPNLSLPHSGMQPAGYVILQHAVRLDRPVQAYGRWMAQVPSTYRHYVLDESPDIAPGVDDDPHCLALLKHYPSLMPMAREARKPMFFLKPADGAIGAHITSVRSCYQDFRSLAVAIAAHCALPLPTSIGVA